MRLFEWKRTRELDLRQRLNDLRRRHFGATGRPLALLCECGDASCHRTVVLTVEEYERRRPGLILHDAHAAADEPLTADAREGAAHDDRRRHVISLDEWRSLK